MPQEENKKEDSRENGVGKKEEKAAVDGTDPHDIKEERIRKII